MLNPCLCLIWTVTSVASVCTELRHGTVLWFSQIQRQQVYSLVPMILNQNNKVHLPSALPMCYSNPALQTATCLPHFPAASVCSQLSPQFLKSCFLTDLNQTHLYPCNKLCNCFGISSRALWPLHFATWWRMTFCSPSITCSKCAVSDILSSAAHAAFSKREEMNKIDQ